MSAFTNYLNSKRVREVLSKRPGDEGFSLIELVVVIAVLAILAAVAIPAFNGIQMDARASAVKSGMANGIKECLVLEARGKSGTDLDFNQAKAFQGEYNSYELTAWGNRTSTCMGVKALPQAHETTLPSLYMYINGDGVVEKGCAPGNAPRPNPNTLGSQVAFSIDPGDPFDSYCW